MRGITGIIAATLAASTALLAAVPARADSADFDAVTSDTGETAGTSALPYLQCVPYARQVSGIRIFGDAHTWWDQAAGHYARGVRPRVGAVMSFRPYGNMRLGHVAAVSRIIDSRTVLLRHANWSLINGRRGQIEDDVRAVDVSEANDWSEVRVWFAPIRGLGTTHWPVNGFIYPDRPAADEPLARTVYAASKPRPSRIGSDFLKGIAGDAPAARQPVKSASRSRSQDPIGDLIARVS
ncbi:CHAP domain-containing protein [Novosphingobium tardum]|uniref:CHAP domain-containing protein n=1 Tax=Novosphingobium tardum TaxID=1538021 RepID=A0ABV8RMG4_9SPHN